MPERALALFPFKGMTCAYAGPGARLTTLQPGLRFETEVAETLEQENVFRPAVRDQSTRMVDLILLAPHDLACRT